MKRRTKIATILTTGLLSAALVGVGFAAWTIGGSGAFDKAQTETGNVQASTVTLGEGYTMKAEILNDITHKNYISFNGPETQSIGGAWLKYTKGGGEEYENLEFSVKITVTGKIPAGKTWNVAFAVDGGHATQWEKYTTDESDSDHDIYIAPTQVYTEETDAGEKFDITQGGEISVTGGAATEFIQPVEFTFKVKLNWGEDLGGTNPYTYFNTSKTQAEFGDAAKAALEALHEFDEATFTVTITEKAGE